MTTTIVDLAITYAIRNWPVLPLSGKIPLAALVPHGVKDATTDPETITTWWLMQPDANAGVSTGQASGLVVLDIDPRHGGDESLLELEAQYGRLPATLEVLTGGGGRHLYFKYPDGATVRNSSGLLGPGLDVKSDGGYVVAPPSIHPDTGQPYMWEASSDPERDEPAEMPQWLIDLLAAPQPNPNGHKPQSGGKAGKVTQGGRNAWLTSEAGRMRRAGMDEAAILAALKTLNADRCDPPLDDAEVAKIAHSVCRYQPGYALTDAGNAEYFADQQVNRVIYRHDLRRWFVWRPPVWVADADGEVERLALEAVRERQAQALSIQDADQRKKAITFLLNSESGYRLRSTLEVAKSLKPLARSGEEFDRQPMLLAVQNGVIDLETGQFREGKPEDYLTQCAGTHYDPQARAPRWEQFVSEIFLGDADLAAFLQRLVGYSITGVTREQVFMFCYGEQGRNGKGTLFRVLRALLKDYAKDTAFATFTAKQEGGGHQESLMALEGARLVTAAESSSVGALNEAIIKRLTGQDPITGSRKFGHEHTYIPEFKLWLAANNLPKVNDVTPAFWRRVILLPFKAKFEGKNDDKNLTEKLVLELPGILNWALEGCRAYLREGLNPPQRCIDAAEAWRHDNDPLAEFLATCKVDPKLEIKVSDLFTAYEQFCSLNNVRQQVKSIQAFSRLIQAHGFEREVRKTGKYFLGIGL